LSLPRFPARDSLCSYFEKAMGNLDGYRLVAFAEWTGDCTLIRDELASTQAARALDFVGSVFI